jgi:hypothetical protein
VYVLRNPVRAALHARSCTPIPKLRVSRVCASEEIRGWAPNDLDPNKYRSARIWISVIDDLEDGAFGINKYR